MLGDVSVKEGRRRRGNHALTRRASRLRDNVGSPTVRTTPNGQTTRNCALAEDERGIIRNIKSGAEFTMKDPCVELGPQSGFNAEAYAAVLIAVREFLTAALLK
ncbi:MAG: hypothetical protein HY246_08425 [Proteobacteria bacterium]|nr:hypothetical protein [Pseudomonadota bacterium]